jgi:predicted acyltransferase
MNAAIDKPATATQRLTSVDAYRGLVMLLMMAEVLRLPAVGRATGSAFWQFLGRHHTHVDWVGCVLHDLIQPSFSFLVGVALPFSIASRLARGQSTARMTLHAFWRALVLICLGFFLRSLDRPQTNFTFEDTLTQIGLGYGFLFLLGLRSTRAAYVALGSILVGYWLLFAVYPLPPAGFDYAKVGVPAKFLAEHGLTGFAAHWQKNSNVAWAFDTWFLNLFPREKPFTHNPGGYATLSFIPTLATMILGLLAGQVLRSDRTPRRKLTWLTVAGVVSLAAGLLLHAAGVCPIVKKIWTPSWVLFSGGICFGFQAAFYAVVDLARLRGWAFPLVVIGTNSIAAYVIAHVSERFTSDAIPRHLPANTYTIAGKAY